MKVLAIAFGAFVALAAAVPTTNYEDKAMFVRENGPNQDCFPEYHSTSVSTSTSPPTSAAPPLHCDETCMKYHCCYPWGECYCQAEALAEFEQFDAQFGNQTYSTSTSTPSLTTTSPPPPPPSCDPRCDKYHCCNSFHGCDCLAETLDELERAEKEGINLSIEAAAQNVNPSQVDLGSEANANYRCPNPCGPVGAGCCWFGTPPKESYCACPKGLFPSLHAQNKAAVEKRNTLSKRCSPECSVLRDDLKMCKKACKTEDPVCEPTCENKTCEKPGIEKCDFPKCGN